MARKKWRAGKLFKGGPFKTKGRWWYPNGSKRGKVWLKHPQKPWNGKRR